MQLSVHYFPILSVKTAGHGTNSYNKILVAYLDKPLRCSAALFRSTRARRVRRTSLRHTRRTAFTAPRVDHQSGEDKIRKLGSDADKHSDRGFTTLCVCLGVVVGQVFFLFVMFSR